MADHSDQPAVKSTGAVDGGLNPARPAAAAGAASSSSTAPQPSRTTPSSTAWAHVQLARHADRPHSLDYIQRIFDDFHELHGDRYFADDPAIVGGFAFFQGEPVMVIGQQKGRDTSQKVLRNFGMSKPEGYRKALRLMLMAAQYRRPIFTFLDTPGAYPGIDAEERGQAEAIARNLREMADLAVPLIATCIGEGGSGGALGLGVGNRVLILEHAYYSVISPESCAAIVWRDAGQKELAAEALKLTSHDLLGLGIVDEVIREPGEGAHTDYDGAAENLGACLAKHLQELAKLGPEELAADRYEKFRRMGNFFQESA